MSISTYFIKASTRKEAITKTRADNTIKSIELLSHRVAKVTDSSGIELLAVVTDLVTGQGSENLFKVEIDLFPT
jgi:hypothetical protein